MGFKAARNVDREVLFAWREGRQHPVAFLPAGILIVVAAKTDDGAAPQLGFGARYFAHEREESKGILTLLLTVDGVEEGFDAGIVGFGLEFGHASPLSLCAPP